MICYPKKDVRSSGTIRIPGQVRAALCVLLTTTLSVVFGFLESPNVQRSDSVRILAVSGQATSLLPGRISQRVESAKQHSAFDFHLLLPSIDIPALDGEGALAICKTSGPTSLYARGSRSGRSPPACNLLTN